MLLMLFSEIIIFYSFFNHIKSQPSNYSGKICKLIKWLLDKQGHFYIVSIKGAEQCALFFLSRLVLQ